MKISNFALHANDSVFFKCKCELKRLQNFKETAENI